MVRSGDASRTSQVERSVARAEREVCPGNPPVRVSCRALGKRWHCRVVQEDGAAYEMTVGGFLFVSC